MTTTRIDEQIDAESRLIYSMSIRENQQFSNVRYPFACWLDPWRCNQVMSSHRLVFSPIVSPRNRSPRLVLDDGDAITSMTVAINDRFPNGLMANRRWEIRQFDIRSWRSLLELDNRKHSRTSRPGHAAVEDMNASSVRWRSVCERTAIEDV